MKPGRTTLPVASMRLPWKFLIAFFGATFATRPFSIRTEWPGRTWEVLPKVSTVPFSMSSEVGMGSAFFQRGQFLQRAVAHGDCAGKTFLRTERAADAMARVKRRHAATVQFDGLIRTARAVAAMLAERGEDLREFLCRRQRAKVGDWIGQRRADEFLHRAEAALFHQIAEARMKFAHVAEAILHHGGAELDGLSAESEEVRGVLVGHRAAIAGDGDAGAGNLREREIADRQHAFAGHTDDDAFFPTARLEFKL